MSCCSGRWDTLQIGSFMRVPQRGIFAHSGPYALFAPSGELTTNFHQCAIIAADYKLNFTPGKSEHITALHERVGDRLLNLFSTNGGLYIKFGVSRFLTVRRLFEMMYRQWSDMISRSSNWGKCCAFTKTHVGQIFTAIQRCTPSPLRRRCSRFSGRVRLSSKWP
jgi:hypothetical protein